MSSSLRITGDWQAQTANNSLLYQVGTACSFSYFLKFNAAFGAPAFGEVFWKGAGYEDIAVVAYPGGGLPSSTLHFVFDTLSYNLVFQTGITYHVAVSWQASALCTLYVNRVAVATSTGSANSGGSNSYLAFGYTIGTGGSPDYQVANMAVWNGYALTASDVVKLRDQSAAPNTIGTGTLAWWTLSGTIGAQAAITDAGFLDSGGGGNPFTTLAAGSVANKANYAAPLAYKPPTTITPIVTKCGTAVKFQAISSGDGTNQNLTAIAADPTIQVNFGGIGSPQTVTIGSKMWSDNTDPSAGPVHCLPFVMYPIFCGPVSRVIVQKGGSGYSAGVTATCSAPGGGGVTCVLGTPILSSGIITSIPVITPGSGYPSPPTITITGGGGSGAVAVPLMGGVTASDLVTYTGVSDGWLTSSAGVAPGVPGPYVPSNYVAVYTGQNEPGIGGYTGFDQPAASRTTKLGFVIGHPTQNWNGIYSACANWFKRATYGSGVTSFGPGLQPLTINGTAGTPTYLGIILPDPQFVDNTSYPVVDGTWTFQVDETLPASPMHVSMTDQYGAAIVTTTQAGTATTGLTSITLGAGGSGYTDVPKVTIIGNGVGAEAYATLGVGTGVVTGVYLKRVGIGYTGAVTVQITGGGGSGAAATATIGNVVSGKVWQFAVTRSNFVNMGLLLNFWNPLQSGSYAYTLCGEWLSSPAETFAALPGLPSRTDVAGPSQSLISWLTGGGRFNPAALRFVDSGFSYGGESNAIDAEDIKPVDSWSYAPLADSAGAANPTAQRSFTVNTIRTYAPSSSGWPGGWTVSWSSPKLYTSQWGTPTPGWTTYGQGFGGPFYKSPADPGFMNWSFGQWYVAEALTTTDHNLKTGQRITWVSGSTAYTVSTNGTGGGTVSLTDVVNSTFRVFVTGPRSFVFTFYNTGVTSVATGLPGAINNVVGNQSVTYVFRCVVPDDSTLPPEVCAKIVNGFPGCDAYITIPSAMTDAASTALANRWLDNLDPSRNLHVAFSNENWNVTTFSSGMFTTIMGNLGTWASISSNGAQSYTARAAQHHDLWDAISKARGRTGKVLRLFEGQMGGPGITSTIVTYINSHNLKMDEFSIANYQDVISQAGTTTAASSLATHWPTSDSYLGTNPTTRGLWCDWMRHSLRYSSVTNGLTGNYAQHQAALAVYTPPAGSGQPPGFLPALIHYEGGVEIVMTGVDTGADTNGFYLRNQLTHDIFYAPEFYDVMLALYESTQAGGCSMMCLYSLCMEFNGGSGDSAGCFVWCSANYANQGGGKGDGSLATFPGAVPAAVTNKYWCDTGKAQFLTNVSPALQAYQDWAANANAPAASQGGHARAWFPGLSRPRS